VVDPNCENHHLFNLNSGRSIKLYASVTVVALNATLADVFSTAFSNMDIDLIQNVIDNRKDIEVRLTYFSGEIQILKSQI